MQEKYQRGLLIVLEGLDRCGKSTQVNRIQEFLNQQNKKSEIIRFPERTTQLGQTIDQYLKGSKNLSNEVIHLLFSANRWEYQDKMKELLTNNVNLIIDRYAYSGVVYSAAKGLDLEWCKNSDKGILKPDICFYLEGDSNILSQRGNFGGEIYEKQEFQEKVKQQYNILKKQENWVIINANDSIDNIFQNIKKEMELLLTQDVQLIQQCQKLWV